MNTVSQQQLLAEAEQLCEQRNVRLTPQRLEVLRLMSQQSGAISAYDLLDLLKQSEPQAKPPTIYRALDFLLEHGFIHRVESTNSFVMCHHFAEPGHTSAFFICDRCGQVTEQPMQGIEDILRTLADKAGFRMVTNMVEVHGFCTDCAPVADCQQSEDCGHDHSIAIKKR
ncbi:zinc uptake transcriptional repressor Zur [Biostraticola tofi]|uniref:Fur family zinc uptake regulator n=1 Tax=Biostraticola tofi TaxID=466109 RepID=A0A4R3YMY7_9GAMM|nr:zinc uptake transcriptional repressor Zur [Biostraticola tofi]TCV92494.1 Fur family zinc uptake regulator [Biostraticola tofi]